MSQLEQYLSSFKNKVVTVVGDLMLDDYVWGKAARISPEAPVMVLDAQRDSRVPGGAANVAHNIVSIGGKANLVGVIGEDDAGAALQQCLQDLCVETDHIVRDATRQTTRKTRIIAQHQQVLRLDREERGPLSAETSNHVTESAIAALKNSDALVLSDYRKGCLNEERVRTLIAVAKEMRKPCVANPKPATISWYAGTDLVSINRHEAEGFVGLEEPTNEELSHATQSKLWECGIENGLVTLGEDGMVLLGERMTPIRALRVEVYDTAGAGDTVIATIALALGAGIDMTVAARIANLAAGCVVRHVGVAVPTPQELVDLARSHHFSV
jgi:rfaE bifunctional protein kinase chain/domain